MVDLRQFGRMKDELDFKTSCPGIPLVERRGLLVHGKSGVKESRSKLTPNKNGAQAAPTIPSWAINRQHTANLSKQPVDGRKQPAPRPSLSLNEQNQFLGLSHETDDAQTHSPYMRDPSFDGNAQAAIHDKGRSHVAPLLSIQDVAILLNVSTKTVRRLIDRDTLGAVRIGRSVRIRHEVLAAYINRRLA